MMKFVRGNGKVAPLVMSRKGLEALSNEKDINWGDGSGTDETEFSRSSGSIGSIDEEEVMEEEAQQQQQLLLPQPDEENKTLHQQIPKPLGMLSEVNKVIPQPSLREPKSQGGSVILASPVAASRPAMTTPLPRNRHRRTSSAMPRLETLYEGRASVPTAHKPPLPPTRALRANSSPSSLEATHTTAAATRVTPTPSTTGEAFPRHGATRSMSFSHHLPGYPSAPLAEQDPATPRPQRLHRRTFSAPPKQPQDLCSVSSLHQQLKQLQQQYGEEHAMVATTWNWLGNAHFRQGNMEAALQAYKKAVLCEPGEHLADAYANMGTVHWATGNVQEAIPLLQNALAVHEYNVMGRGQDPNTCLPVAAVQYQLGLALTLDQDYKAALQSLYQARTIRERVLGSQHMDVARTLDAMGKVYSLQGNGPAALDCYIRALDIKESLLLLSSSSSSPDAAVRSSMGTTMTNIVAVHRAMHQLAEAGIWMHRLLGHQKKEFLALKTKSTCADVGASLITLGEIYQSARQDPEAVACFREADVYLGKARVPEDDPRRIRLREYIAT